MNSEPKSAAPIVYVVDDEPAVRDSLRLLFQSVGLAVQGFPDAASFLAQPLGEGPACLVSDLRMPMTSGIDLLEALQKRGTRIPAVMISGHGDVKLAVRALKSGAIDFIEKPFDDQELLDAVNGALKNAQRSPGIEPDSADCGRHVDQLTPREKEVLQLVVSGKPNKLIARALDISTRTVEAHRAHLMEKLEVGSLAELVRLALQCGIAGVPEDGQAGNLRNQSR